MVENKIRADGADDADSSCVASGRRDARIGRLGKQTAFQTADQRQYTGDLWSELGGIASGRINLWLVLWWDRFGAGGGDRRRLPVSLSRAAGGLFRGLLPCLSPYAGSS